MDVPLCWDRPPLLGMGPPWNLGIGRRHEQLQVDGTCSITNKAASRWLFSSTFYTNSNERGFLTMSSVLHKKGGLYKCVCAVCISILTLLRHCLCTCVWQMGL